MHKYKIVTGDGHAIVLDGVTDDEHDLASDIAITTLVMAGFENPDDSIVDGLQTTLQIGIVMGLRSAESPVSTPVEMTCIPCKGSGCLCLIEGRTEDQHETCGACDGRGFVTRPVLTGDVGGSGVGDQGFVTRPFLPGDSIDSIVSIPLAERREMSDAAAARLLADMRRLGVPFTITFGPELGDA